MALYRLLDEEKEWFFVIAAFYVRVKRKHDKSLQATSGIIADRRIKCELLGFENTTSYYDHIDDKKLEFIAFSPRAIQKFEATVNNLFLTNDVKAEKDYGAIHALFRKLNDRLKVKLRTDEFLVSPSNDGVSGKLIKPKSPTFFKSFKDTGWRLYDNFAGEIKGRPFWFEKPINNDTYAVRLGAYNRLHPCIGEARFKEEDEIIVITLTHSQTRREYNHIILETESRAERFDIALGHMSFNSNNNNNIVTKFVMLMRQEDVATGAQSEEVPSYIKDTFSRMNCTVMTLSHDLTIHDVPSLKDALTRVWVQKS